MWTEACERLAQAERLHRQYFRLNEGEAMGRAWEPPIDVVESESELTVTIAMPGIDVTTLSVRVGAGTVVIGATRPAHRTPGLAIRRLEIPYGEFRRRVALPTGCYSLLEQTYSQGCLTLRFAKH